MLATGYILALAFLLGSVLGGQIVSRLRGLNLRQSGSGNLGATNALRSGGAPIGLLVLVIDAGKAWAAASLLPLLAIEAEAWLPWACAALAVLGHIYSPWAGFNGGKGAASGIGAYLALMPTALAVGLAGFIPALVLSGYVSLSILLAASLILLYVTCFSVVGIQSYAGAFAAGMLLLLCWTHRSNLLRLARGTEHRFEKIMLIKPR